MNLNKVNLDKMIEEHYISVQKHDTEELYIYNYTQKAQYDKMWNQETMSCRGLIMDNNFNIVARPFKKFFNFEEVEGKIPDNDFKVYEKYDGSLGILYWVNEEPFIATRGSFNSEQAKKGTEILRKTDTSKLNKNYTYLFEIIYPENRIVVDYGKEEKLVLLAIIETKTGVELPLESDIFEVAKLYDGFNLEVINKIRKENKNDEGFVLKWNNGYRLKMKNEEYVRLHRLVTQVTARSIWDLLKNNKPVDELLDRVPDEFFKWVKSVVERLEKQYQEIYDESYNVYREVKELPTRKEQALFIKNKSKHSKVVFCLLDNKLVSEIIWKILYPKHETPFKQEIE